MYTVYVLYSPKFKKTYVGYTSSLTNRLASHNELATKGYTLKFRPWIVLITEHYETKTQAIKRERELKSGKGREYIKTVLNKRFP
ncbi:MAG: GIY-YIG nuclease family protein [Cyclobacteriaceae bacterium]|nr:GIY-YIG nuclease family protein [Cyclobacteriaceae bacterium]MBX2962946.1 GIY-YIG nuclease family protein [Cyclobacteriaceae bacterium]